MKWFSKKSSKKEPKVSYGTAKLIDEFMKEKYSWENKINTLEKTKDINLFFETINTVDGVDRLSLEKGLIDRCFEGIDFTKEEDLKDLYTKLKLYKNDFMEESVKYAIKLFKYCEENYINKN